MYKFEKKMREWDIDSLNDPNLDGQFVSEAKEFLRKVDNKELDDDNIIKEDERLMELFDSLHEQLLEDSEAVRIEKIKNKKLKEENEKIRKNNIINKAQISISKINDIADLEKLKEDYKDVPEALAIVEGKIQWLKEEQKKKDETKAKEAEAEAKAKAKAKAEAEAERIAKEKEQAPTKKMIDGLKKLSKMKGYYANYDDLRAIGIKPTGDDMEIKGFKLIRQFSFKVYKIVPPKE